MDGSLENGKNQALKRRTLSTDVDEILLRPTLSAHLDNDDATSTTTQTYVTQRRNWPVRPTPFADHPIREMGPQSPRANASCISKGNRGTTKDFRDLFAPLISIKSHYDLSAVYRFQGSSASSVQQRLCGGLCFKLSVLLVIVFMSMFVTAIFLEPVQHEGFVRRQGLQFELDCRPFYLVGFNTHDLMEGALVTPSHFRTVGGMSGRQLIKKMFQDASSAGLNTLRTWAHTNDANFPFQIKPGEYDGVAFQSLDYILEESRRNGMRIILSFVDNWKYYNGVAQYVDWSTTAPPRNQTRPVDEFGDPNPVTYAHESEKRYETARHILFFTDPDCTRMYKSHVLTILNRVNKFNGRKYKDDPTIMAWDLLNEPRCEKWMIPNCPDILQNWLSEMSEFVKTHDPNHLVTIGSEGFFTDGSQHVAQNPQDWAAEMGQDFIKNNKIATIDFATIHVWPNNWNRTSSQFQQKWIQYHLQVSNSEIKKPMLIEEFGKKLIEANEQSKQGVATLRDPVYNLTYELVQNGIKDKLGIGGSLFWRWHMPKFAGQGTGEYGVQPEDTTFPIIKRHAHYINTLVNSSPPDPKCKLECWTPERQWWGLVRKCVKNSKACSDHNNQSNQSERHKLFYTSKRACCRMGSGAFEGRGCSWTSLIL